MAKTLSFSDVGKSCQSHGFLRGKCLLTLFAKIKFSQKFPNLQYFIIWASMRVNSTLLLATTKVQTSLCIGTV